MALMKTIPSPGQKCKALVPRDFRPRSGSEANRNCRSPLNTPSASSTRKGATDQKPLRGNRAIPRGNLDDDSLVHRRTRP